MNSPDGGEVEIRAAAGRRLILTGVLVNILLAVAKFAGGVLGNSSALIADAIESALDIFSSGMMWAALKVAARPPDASHPYGHGKVESLAAVAGALVLLGAGASLAAHSAGEILNSFSSPPTEASLPKAFTLGVLMLAILLKESLYRLFVHRGKAIDSAALLADAWHRRSDAITSLAALIGISIALAGGPSWAPADDWAALFSCGIILFNGGRMLRGSLGEILDEQMPDALIDQVLDQVRSVEGVTSVEKCRVRKSGLTRIADLHVRVAGGSSVREGHEVAHIVKNRLLASGLNISDVTVHIEPERD